MIGVMAIDASTSPNEATGAASVTGRGRRVLVIGAGVIGLTCAVSLAEVGYEVHVLARDLPGETTSAVAAAIWFPYQALPQDRVTAWAATSYAAFTRLAHDHPESGVRVRTGRELVRTPTSRPWWAGAVPDLRTVTSAPPGYTGGWEFDAPVVDMGVYLPYLVDRLTALGGTLTRQALPGLPNTAPIVVNCSGLASRHLAGDLTLTPVRGQVCVLDQVGISEWWIDDTDPDRPLYVVPRLDEIVVGGTSEPGDWDTHPRPETAREILAAATELVPALAGARVRRHRVGLRPRRPSVRLEPEIRDAGRVVVHCYGHGGAGVTLSWGCAAEVVEVVRAHTS
jgi:D-amino-acid oxidase